jgi:hypothetical protein
MRHAPLIRPMALCALRNPRPGPADQAHGLGGRAFSKAFLMLDFFSSFERS